MGIQWKTILITGLAVVLLARGGKTTSPTDEEEEEKDEEEEKEDRNLLFYDHTTIINNLLKGLWFYTRGYANVVVPLKNAAYKTPAIALVGLWLLMLALFYQYTQGALLGGRAAASQRASNTSLNDRNAAFTDDLMAALERAIATYREHRDDTRVESVNA